MSDSIEFAADDDLVDVEDFSADATAMSADEARRAQKATDFIVFMVSCQGKSIQGMSDRK